LAEKPALQLQDLLESIAILFFTIMGLTTLQPLAYAVAYVTFFFGVVSTVLRFYCRQYVLKIWGLDDYIAVAILVIHLRPAMTMKQ
jgi:hypothetical protein